MTAIETLVGDRRGNSSFASTIGGAGAPPKHSNEAFLNLEGWQVAKQESEITSLKRHSRM
jgi:hypothetical protein